VWHAPMLNDVFATWTTLANFLRFLQARVDDVESSSSSLKLQTVQKALDEALTVSEIAPREGDFTKKFDNLLESLDLPYECCGVTPSLPDGPERPLTLSQKYKLITPFAVRAGHRWVVLLLLLALALKAHGRRARR